MLSGVGIDFEDKKNSPKKFQRFSLKHALGKRKKTLNTSPGNTLHLEDVGELKLRILKPVFTKIIDHLKQFGIQEEGILRISGNHTEIARLKSLFIKGEEVKFDEFTIEDIAGAFKALLRELPDPLFTNARYNDILKTLEVQEKENRLSILSFIFASLPPDNVEIIIQIMELTDKIRKNPVTKMDARNLAVVLGPTLLRTNNAERMESLLEDSEHVIQAIAEIIENHDKILGKGKNKKVFLSKSMSILPDRDKEIFEDQITNMAYALRSERQEKQYFEAEVKKLKLLNESLQEQLENEINSKNTLMEQLESMFHSGTLILNSSVFEDLDKYERLKNENAALENEIVILTERMDILADHKPLNLFKDCDDYYNQLYTSAM